MADSQDAINRFKRRYGLNLEGLSIRDRYIVVMVLAAALQEQKTVYELCANNKYLHGELRAVDAGELIYDLHLLVMPNVLKFLSESIPASF